MNYYTEIETYIKKNEVSKKVKVLEENQSTLENYWNIGRLLVEAQGGEKRAKYGNGLIKERSIKYTEKYGKGYDSTNLRKFRQFYLLFQKCDTLSRIFWSQIILLLPIKEENKRNYYINLCITRNLSVRELKNEIKNNSYERLINKPSKIEIIIPSTKYSPLDTVKDPIIIEIDEDKSIETEHDLEISILSKLQVFFSQLGEGFALIDNQYKISYGNKNYYIDILLFNIELNCYVVVELKLRELKKEDKAQIEFYMQIVNKQMKKAFHNKTIGIIISKHQNQLIANFVRSESIIPITYEIKKEDIF